MDIKKKINEIVDKVKNDKSFAKKFQKDPIKAVEEVLGVDLPNDQIEKIVDGVKTKISADKAGDMIKGLLNK
jgi:predicted hydrolase (HD superfamily)